MRKNNISGSRYPLFFLALAAMSSTAAAGPPLVCHPMSIGGARSLPGASSPKGNWSDLRSDYDTKNLANDTVALLDEAVPVIVRMETLRRATVYGMRDGAAARELLNRMKTRALRKSVAKNAALALFDYGYLIETMKQGWGTKDLRDQVGPANGLEGYPYIQQALQLRQGDAEMEFAASIVALWPKLPGQQEHFRRALAAADKDPLLLENLLSHYSDRGRTLAELRENANLIAKKN